MGRLGGGMCIGLKMGGVAWAVHVWEVVAMCKRWYMSR